MWNIHILQNLHFIKRWKRPFHTPENILCVRQIFEIFDKPARWAETAGTGKSDSREAGREGNESGNGKKTFWSKKKRGKRAEMVNNFSHQMIEFFPGENQEGHPAPQSNGHWIDIKS